MKPQILRNLDHKQTHLSVDHDYTFFIAPMTEATEDNYQFQMASSFNLRPFEKIPPETMVKKLSSLHLLQGCLVDHRIGFRPKLFLSRENFAFIQTHTQQVIQCQNALSYSWLSFDLPVDAFRVIGGHHTWISDLGASLLADIIKESSKSTPLEKILFNIMHERHCLGFEDPTPFLYGADELQLRLS